MSEDLEMYKKFIKVVEEKNEALEEENQELKEENQELENEINLLTNDIQSIKRAKEYNRYTKVRKSNQMYKEDNKELRQDKKNYESILNDKNKIIEGLTKENNEYKEEIHNKILNSFVDKEIPNLDHFIYKKLIQLISEYPDKEYVHKYLIEWFQDFKKDDTNNIELIIKNQHKIIESFNKAVERKVTQLNKNIDEAQKEILKLEDDKYNIKVIKDYIKNPAYFDKMYETICEKEEFYDKFQNEVIDKIDYSNSIDYGYNQNSQTLENIQNECQKVFSYISNSNQYNNFRIICEHGNQTTQINHICHELQKQLHLCRNEDRGINYISNGQGGFQIFDSSNINNIYSKIANNCYTLPKNSYNTDNVTKISFLTRDKLFEKKGVIGFIDQTITPDIDLISFENGFINTKNFNQNFDNLKLESLDQKYPRLALRHINYPLVLDRKIENTLMEQIFNECFTEKDKQLVLMYIGACIYEQGYTKHQFSLYIMGRGSIGKTSLFFNTIIAKIFNSDFINVAKIKNDNQFAFSKLLSHIDVVGIDEISNGLDSFNETIKDVTGGGFVDAEKKYSDSRTLNPEFVPHFVILGNWFNIPFYESIVDISNLRRILPIIPIKSFNEFGATPRDLGTDENMMWVIQEASRVYWNSNMPKKDLDIFRIHPELITVDMIKERIRLLTFAEQEVLKKHFKLNRVDFNGNFIIDVEEGVFLKPLVDFIKAEVDNQMLSTRTKENDKSFLREVKNAFEIDSSEIFEQHRDGQKYILGLSPITDKARDYLAAWEDNNNIDVNVWFSLNNDNYDDSLLYNDIK